MTGNTQECTCPGGVASFQTCNDPGVWGTCQCDGVTGGTGGTVTGGTGGTVTGGTGGTVTGGTGGDLTGGTGGTVTGGSGGAAGAAGAPEPVKDCATKTVVTQPLITDFESYDGTDVGTWGFSFNGDATGIGAVYAGPFAYDDATGTPSFLMTAGNASTYGLSIANTQASAWGGGLGFWMSCIDASSYGGISFWVLGPVPLGTVTLTLSMESTSPPDELEPAAGGTCIATGVDGECSGPSYDFAVADTWTQVTIPWSAFTAGTAATGVSVPATGDLVTGLTFNVGLAWAEDPANPGTYIPTPAAYTFVIDDITFY